MSATDAGGREDLPILPERELKVLPKTRAQFSVVKSS